MRLNISSNSRRKPNKSSNNLSAVYRFLMTSSSIEFRLTRGVVLPDSKAAAGGGAIFPPERAVRRNYPRLSDLRASPLPLSEGYWRCQVKPRYGHDARR